MPELVTPYVVPGCFAVTMRPIGDRSSPYHIPQGEIVRVTGVAAGTPPKRACNIAYVHSDEKTIGTAQVLEHDLRVVALAKPDPLYD